MNRIATIKVWLLIQTMPWSGQSTSVTQTPGTARQDRLSRPLRKARDLREHRRGAGIDGMKKHCLTIRWCFSFYGGNELSQIVRMKFLCLEVNNDKAAQF